MATYAIGDIQGCYDTLQRLLELIEFDADGDRLWLAGDLVNRGPRSLDVLRWARGLGDRAVAVLGNHDTHLLRRTAGVTGKKKRDTLDAVLEAPDRDELVDWLRHRPLIHVDDGFAMMHAGLHPTWSIADAQALSDEVCAVLQADDWRARLPEVLDHRSAQWRRDLPGSERLAAATNVFTRIRTCRSNGDMCRKFAGPKDQAPAGCIPWFELPDARWRDHQVLFGHWAALGFTRSDHHASLDSGCVWGGKLSALRLDDSTLFQVAALEPLPDGMGPAERAQ